MDPITTALIAALTAGAASGMPKVAEKAITDGYEGLKSLLRSRTGERSEVVQAVEKLEAQPESAGRREVVAEEVMAAELDRDPQLEIAARELLDRIQALPGGRQHVASVTAGGERSIAIGGDIHVAHISTGDRQAAPPRAN